MNKIQKGKTGLMTMGILSLLLSVLSVVGSVLLIINSVTNGVSVVGLIFGILLALIFIPLFIIGVYFVWVGAVIVATQGSVAEDNEGNGTMNATLCAKCGQKLTTEAFCPNCGAKTAKSITCPKCRCNNNIENSHCVNCGQNLN